MRSSHYRLRPPVGSSVSVAVVSAIMFCTTRPNCPRSTITHCSEPKLDQTLPNMASGLPPHRHGRHRHYHYHQRRAALSSGTALLKYHFSRRPRASSDDDLNPEREGEVASYMDVVAVSKWRPLAPIVGKLRSVKSASEIEVMKASAEISARALLIPKR